MFQCLKLWSCGLVCNWRERSMIPWLIISAAYESVERAKWFDLQALCDLVDERLWLCGEYGSSNDIAMRVRERESVCLCKDNFFLHWLACSLLILTNWILVHHCISISFTLIYSNAIMSSPFCCVCVACEDIGCIGRGFWSDRGWWGNKWWVIAYALLPFCKVGGWWWLYLAVSLCTWVCLGVGDLRKIL